MTYKSALIEFKRMYYATLMEECGDKVPKVARIAGVNRTQVYKVLRLTRIKKPRLYGNERWRELGRRLATAQTNEVPQSNMAYLD
jgi:hypothetical protein